MTKAVSNRGDTQSTGEEKIVHLYVKQMLVTEMDNTSLT